MRRRIIREKVVQSLYAHEITGDSVEHIVRNGLVGLESNKDAHEFAEKLVVTSIDRAGEIDAIIKAKVANWDFNRIAMLDRLILRMAICELMYFKDIPPKVSINEAIELAKLFSTEKSGQFVNGVLDAVASDLRLSGEMTKSGRGLNEGEDSDRLKRAKPKKV